LTIPKIGVTMVLTIKEDEKMEKPILVYQKNADKTTNKMIIPKAIIEQWGNSFYMEIYQDKIILKPIKKGE
jgi:hypothetical protein